MADKNIRPKALKWFNTRHKMDGGKVYTSKFFTALESWSKSEVWFFQIPLKLFTGGRDRVIHLLCEDNLRDDEFIYIKVNSGFFLKNLQHFDMDKNEKMLRMYLSADKNNRFREVRGHGKIDFREFVVRGNDPIMAIHPYD